MDDLTSNTQQTDEDVQHHALTQKVKDFSSLLHSIESLDDKKRQLWREIYENAITDRSVAYAMFAKLVKITQDKSGEHAVHGKTMATYIERMSKSNEQLIRLAELIAKAEEKDGDIDETDIYTRIAKGGGN